jgi:hypothetical protein
MTVTNPKYTWDRQQGAFKELGKHHLYTCRAVVYILE